MTAAAIGVGFLVVNHAGMVATFILYPLHDLRMTRRTLQFLAAQPERMAFAALQDAFDVGVTTG